MTVETRSKKARIAKVTVSVLFVLYLCFFAYVTLFSGRYGRSFPSIRDLDPEKIAEHFRWHSSLAPFATVTDFIRGYLKGNVGIHAITVNILGNLAATAPFGFFVPFLSKKKVGVLRLVLTVFATVLAIEVLQILLMTGSFDVDDLILNVLGALITFGILKIPPIEKAVFKLTKKQI